MQAFEILNQVLEEMYDDIPGNTEDEKDAAVTAALDRYAGDYAELKEQNTADHSPHTHRFAYIYKHVAVHADIVRSAIENSNQLSALFENGNIDLASFGGGPGSDLLGVLKYMEMSKKGPYLTSYLYDREKGWGDCWADIGKKTSGSYSITAMPVQVDVCDLDDLKYLKKCFSADLITMVFFISELYSRRHEAGPFLTAVFEKAKVGSHFLYIDNGDPQEDFKNWMRSLVTPHGFKCIKSSTGWHQIETSEEKKSLGRFLEKYKGNHHPKLRAYVTQDIYVKE